MQGGPVFLGSLGSGPVVRDQSNLSSLLLSPVFFEAVAFSFALVPLDDVAKA